MESPRHRFERFETLTLKGIEQMSILITGGTGFIGTRLVSYLANRGERVHVLGLPTPEMSASPHPRVRLFLGDILSRRDVDQAMEGCDRVFHLAAYARNWAPDPQTFYDVNVSGTEIVLSSALKLGVRRVVHTSSNLTFGPSNGSEVTECTRRTAPFFTPYEHSKYVAEELVRKYVQLGLDAVIVNPTRVFGPGPLNESNSVTKMIAMYVRGSWRLILGNGRMIGNYVFLDDLVRGYDLAMQHGRTGENYILGGENVSFNEFFATLAGVAERNRLLLHLPALAAMLFSEEEELRARLLGMYPLITPGWAQTFLTDWAYSSRRAQLEIGYEITPLAGALRLTLDWLIRANAVAPFDLERHVAPHLEPMEAIR